MLNTIESLTLFYCDRHIDCHVSGVPTSVVNFVTRTAIGRIWSMLLEVAEQVRDGKRPVHKAAIDAEPELYEWIESRVSSMLDKMNKEETVHDNE